jgi:hypothetical protein
MSGWLSPTGGGVVEDVVVNQCGGLEQLHRGGNLCGLERVRASARFVRGYHQRCAEPFSAGSTGAQRVYQFHVCDTYRRNRPRSCIDGSLQRVFDLL